MARHDYDLPPDYEKRVAEGTMVDWFTRERCRRQATRMCFSYRQRVENPSHRVQPDLWKRPAGLDAAPITDNDNDSNDFRVE